MLTMPGRGRLRVWNHRPMIPTLRRRVLVLEWATIVWNAGEFLLTVGLGIAARSLALVAFGLDSLVEVFASLVVVWHAADSEESPPGRTQRALRLVAMAFAGLAVLLVIGALGALTAGHRPAESPWGIGYLAVTALVMFGLAIVKMRTAGDNGSTPLAAEARLTFLDGCLAIGILTALAVNATIGWWWADPIATLLVAAACAGEARENWREAGPARSTQRPRSSS